jgi:hypothetical protein
MRSFVAVKLRMGEDTSQHVWLSWFGSEAGDAARNWARTLTVGSSGTTELSWLKSPGRPRDYDKAPYNGWYVVEDPTPPEWGEVSP